MSRDADYVPGDHHYQAEADVARSIANDPCYIPDYLLDQVLNGQEV